MKTLGKYLIRLLKSVPVIAVGIFDIFLFVLNAVGVNINMPIWGYWALLGAGLIIENYRIYFELENQKNEDKKGPQRKEANFNLEARRNDTDSIVVTVFNNEDVDFTEKSAEILGFCKVQPDGNLMNMIDMLGHEKRGLAWYEKENKIEAGGHSLIEVASADWEGMHFGPLIIKHNTDHATWKVGIEVRGKLSGDSIIPKKCCLTFQVEKNVLDGNKVVWIVGWPDLETGDCNWVKTISATEWLEQKRIKDEQENKT